MGFMDGNRTFMSSDSTPEPPKKKTKKSSRKQSGETESKDSIEKIAEYTRNVVLPSI